MTGAVVYIGGLMLCITCSCTVSFYVSAVSSGQECVLASCFEDINSAISLLPLNKLYWWISLQSTACQCCPSLLSPGPLLPLSHPFFRSLCSFSRIWVSGHQNKLRVRMEGRTIDQVKYPQTLVKLKKLGTHTYTNRHITHIKSLTYVLMTLYVLYIPIHLHMETCRFIWLFKTKLYMYVCSCCFDGHTQFLIPSEMPGIFWWNSRKMVSFQQQKVREEEVWMGLARGRGNGRERLYGQLENEGSLTLVQTVHRTVMSSSLSHPQPLCMLSVLFCLERDKLPFNIFHKTLHAFPFCNSWMPPSVRIFDTLFLLLLCSGI